MDAWLRLLSYVNLAGAIHALLQALALLFTRKGDRRANRIMAAFLLALAISLTNGFFSILGTYEAFPPLVIVMGAVALAYGPLFYFFIRAMTDPDRSWAPADVLHAIPVLVGLFGYWARSRTPVAGPAPPGLVGWVVLYPWRAVTVLSTLQTVFYVALIVRRLRAHSARIKATFSTVDRVNLAWLRRRLVVYAGIWTVALAMIAAVGFESPAFGLLMQVVAFLIAVNIFVTGYQALRHSGWTGGPAFAGTGRKYERSSLTPGDAERYRTRLLELVERERLYLDPELTLPKLAGALEIPAAHLSRVINERLGRNFFEFINRYRVEAAQRTLAGPGAGREKLLTVALDCGFSSLATFNRVFKEMTGRTPSEYRKDPPPIVSRPRR